MTSPQPCVSAAIADFRRIKRHRPLLKMSAFGMSSLQPAGWLLTISCRCDASLCLLMEHSCCRLGGVRAWLGVCLRRALISFDLAFNFFVLGGALWVMHVELAYF